MLIRGTIPVSGDRYAIEISFLADYPNSLPQVRETGGRIPWTPDRHVNPEDKTACVCLPDEWFLQRLDTTFLTFLRGPVCNYFLGQKAFEMYGQWPFGERRHGIDGIFDFYKEYLETSDHNVVRNYLTCLSHDVVKGHWDCPCGSGKRIRNCHHQQIADLRKRIPRHIASKYSKHL